jgi:hypothetical protein
MVFELRECYVELNMGRGGWGKQVLHLGHPPPFCAWKPVCLDFVGLFKKLEQW